MSVPAIEVRGLTKSFGSLPVAQAIDLALAPGARAALIGPNGAGKTTFVNLLTGRLRADAGTVSLASLGVLTSGTVLMVVVLGGLRRRWGGYLGALVFVVGQNFAAEIDPFRWMLVIGLMLIAVVMFFENGLAGLVDLVRRRIQASEAGE